MAEINKKVEAIRCNLTKLRPQTHPIKEHPIDECEEFVQKLYLDILCVMAQYENEDTENAIKFIQRIQAGAELKEPITEHIKNAMEITVDKFGEFLRQCKENQLENIFFVDSILVTCANGAPNAKQVEFISEIADTLGIGKKQAGWLCDIAVAILEQDSDKYHAACDNIPHDDKTPIVECVVCYLKEFICGILVDTDELLWIYSKEKAEFDLNAVTEKYNAYYESGTAVEISRKKIILQNLIVSNEYYFKSSDQVDIINCEFLNKCINFENCPDVTIENCIFNFNNNRYSFIYTESTKNISLCNTVFKGCGSIYGQVIRGKIQCSTEIVGCTFENINGADKYDDGIIIISDYKGKTSVSDSSFNNCHTYRSNRPLFYSGTVTTSNCTVNNSTRFTD